YMKDGILSDNIDKIFLKNFRFSKVEDITEFTSMLRDCSYGELLFDSYEYYEKVVFNQKDGYYHVGTETGPLVFADLFNQTHFSSTPILTYFSDEEFLTNDAAGKKIAQYRYIINEYAAYANDSVVGGYVPVTEDLAQVLKAIAEVLGTARGNDDAWLEMCVYFNVYGPTDGIDYIDPVTKEIFNPIKGLAPFDCFEVVEDDITTSDVESTVQLYDRVLISRGYLFKFVPKHTGVYLFYSLGNDETNCTIYDADMNFYAANYESIKYYTYGVGATDENYRGYAYFVAGETYYVKPYYYDTMKYDATMEFVFAYTEKSNVDVLMICSEWPFTTSDDLEGSLGDIESNLITVGINAVLGEDGYYHEKYKDGTISEKKLYVDFENFCAFGYSLAEMINMKAYDFTINENGLPTFDEEGYLLQ
ncbi:MAG: hypothetical protein K2I77_07020, partial [Anaeroplasmataceae bacterium]|nr:hypothetical protein [Anaeroplasmataceae bacterium]